ncbi:zf-C2H2_jaz domain-containing protein [Cephalotus follicularis]|uniref:Zf-C2H2_jaz domain-containing protein n=1 Tax=Cephalotus follicularis TaxID=3775 RepID=A0A1Q3DDM0_CEPFO|nr:zf-C2H2_jaz domain-containing protein [Cephalotus follicularis]
MMNSLIFHQQEQEKHHQQQLVEENMSNLTSASNEASVSSGNRTETGTNYPQQYFAPQAESQPAKKKRNLPGNPDPDAEVIALSPKTLMATNRFVCEICNKGFQRDQNLQLHRRGHNLPWKLKQRTNKEVRKKVYVCPEPSCVHHDPSRALGDLTGIKKHFCRKHGEKKWKCDKCSKKYAVQSDWKAHSKTCGTREYRCDCGTLFSRRDSFITHRAFCDALAEESARAINGANPILSSHHQPGSSNINLQVAQFNSTQDLHGFSLKKEQQSFTLRPELPPWLSCSPVIGGGPDTPQHFDPSSSSSSFFSARLDQEFTQAHHQDLNPNPNPSLGPSILPSYHTAASPHISATALLQKAAQMGATMSIKTGSSTAALTIPHHHQQPHHHQAHVSADSGSSQNNTTGFCLNLSSRDELASGGFVHGMASFGNKAAEVTGATVGFQEMMNSLSSATGFEGTTSFEDAFGGIWNSKKDGNFYDSLSKPTTTRTTPLVSRTDEASNGGGVNGEGTTRDFLGLRALSHSDILNIAGLGNCMNTHEQQKPWQG